jgi:hypothetical protein
VRKHLGDLLLRLDGAERFLQCRRCTALLARDRLVLGPVFARLARNAACVAEGAGDLAMEMQQP